MPYFVYIIESLVDGDFYKGVSEDYLKRLEEHNCGKSYFTSTKTPWVLRYVEHFQNKSDALKREKQLKRQNRKYLLSLFQQPSNILK